MDVSRSTAATYEGTPCRRAGHTLRYVSNGACLECMREEKALYRSTHRLLLREKQARYRDEHREAVREQSARWNANNSIARAALRHRRRIRKLAAPGTPPSVTELLELRLRQRDKCATCGTPLLGKGELDHRVALAKGGRADTSNLWYLCTDCHRGKGVQHPEPWILAAIARCTPDNRPATASVLATLFAGRELEALQHCQRQLELLDYVPARRLSYAA